MRRQTINELFSMPTVTCKYDFFLDNFPQGLWQGSRNIGLHLPTNPSPANGTCIWDDGNHKGFLSHCEATLEVDPANYEYFQNLLALNLLYLGLIKNSIDGYLCGLVLPIKSGRGCLLTVCLSASNYWTQSIDTSLRGK